ncbi:MAG TPA: FAD-binding oxidoreductase, partial [Myxococcota bacterium]|nr:FAD-binding oxidoreductase [Myxococcota bacterium]
EKFCAPLARSLIPVTSFQVATEPLPDELRARILPQGHVCSDTRRVLRYLCVTPEGRLVMGGRGHGRAPDRRELYAHIVASLRELFPEAARAKLDYFWSGRVALTLDHLPKIYELGPGLWAGGGYNGRGVAMATALGSLLAELATGAPGDALPLPPSKPRPIPLHALRGPAIGLAVGWKRLLDGWEARPR